MWERGGCNFRGTGNTESGKLIYLGGSGAVAGFFQVSIERT